MFAAALTLYVATLAPGLLWGGGDFARFQTWAYLGHIEGKVDIFAHPLWVYAAHPFTWLPIRDPAWRANFASAAFASLALVFVFHSARYLTPSRPAALLATAALAVSHTFWTYAVMPKVYSLDALLLAACIYLLFRWRASGSDIYLALFGLLYGFSFLNHLVMATAAAGFVAFICMTLRVTRRAVGRPLVVALTSFAVGLLPYAVLSMQTATARATGGTILAFLVGLAYPLTHPTALLSGVGWGVGLGVYQFPITTAVGVIGLSRLWQQDGTAAVTIGLVILGTVAFLFGALDPEPGNIYVWNLHYYLQAYVVFALAAARGFEVVWTRWCGQHWHRRAVVVLATVVLPVALYASAPFLVRYAVHTVPDFRPLPGRDNFAYVLSPWKQNESGARRYAQAILQSLPPDSVLFADYGPWAVVRYLQIVEHARPDVELVLLTPPKSQLELIREHQDNPNLFLADTYRYYDIDAIGARFEIVPAGPIYKLVPKVTATP